MLCGALTWEMYGITTICFLTQHLCFYLTPQNQVRLTPYLQGCVFSPMSLWRRLKNKLFVGHTEQALWNHTHFSYVSCHALCYYVPQNILEGDQNVFISERCRHTDAHINMLKQALCSSAPQLHLSWCGNGEWERLHKSGNGYIRVGTAVLGLHKTGNHYSDYCAHMWCRLNEKSFSDVHVADQQQHMCMSHVTVCYTFQ